MKYSEFIEIKKAINELEDKILETKGLDYSSDKDFLYSFNNLAEELNLPAEKICWIFLKKHLNAILSRVNGKSQDSEDLKQRIADARNFLLFLYGILE